MSNYAQNNASSTSVRNGIVGLFFLVLGVILLTFIIPIQTIEGDGEELSQAFMPSVAAWLFVIFGFLLFAQAALLKLFQYGSDSAPSSDAGVIDRHFLNAFIISLIGICVSIVSIKWAGYIVGSGLTLFLFALAFNRKHWKSGLVVAISLPWVLYAAVSFGLGLSLP